MNLRSNIVARAGTIAALFILLIFAKDTIAMNDKTFNMKDVYLKVKDHKDLVNVIPDEMATSLPVAVPDKEGTGISMVFFHYYMTRSSAGGKNSSAISSPRRKTRVSYPELAILKTEPATSSTFGIKWDDSKPVGKYTPDPAIPYQSIVEQRDRFFELYDHILPLYLAGAPAAGNEERAKVKEFKQLFSEVGFTALMPYYESLNPEFFKWLDANAN